jgi:TonB-linked SusC/RagA family outer membrane protein
MYKNYTNKFGMPKRHITKIWLIMRLTTVILIATLMQVSATGFAQKISLNKSNAPLKTIFKELRNQSGYVFLCTENQLKLARPVSIIASDIDIKEVLEKIFENQPLTYIINEKTITIKEKEKSIIEKITDYFAQIEVSGRVVDGEGKPLPGATIKVKGTNTIVNANENGDFALKNIDESAILEISFVGFKSREVKVSKTVMSVTLDIETAKLDEVTVVNTGYQTLPKERATGSFTLIDNKRFNEQVATTVLDRLKYITNGLTALPKSSYGNNAFLIRGMSTFTITISKPLIILDNFEYKGDLNNLNPNDVEDITVLKDAAAGSIWGARAANGVIVITTKKGKFDQPIKVNFSSSVNVAGKPDLFYDPKMSPSEYIDFEQFLFSKGFYNGSINNPQFYSLSPVVNTLAKLRSGTITQAQADQVINGYRSHDVRDDFAKYVYQKTVNQQYALSMSGGSKNMAWILSTGVDRNMDQLASPYNRINLHFDQTYTPVKNLSISLGAYFTQSKTENGKDGSIAVRFGSLPPYARLADENGNPLPIYKDYNEGFIDNFGGGNLLDWRYIPLEDYKYHTQTTNIRDLNAVLGINYRFLNSFSVDLKYRQERQTNVGSNLNTIDSYFARDLINLFTVFTTNPITYNIPKGGILDNSIATVNGQNIRAQLNFDKNWNKHSLNMIVGSEISETTVDGNIYRTYGYDPDILSAAQVNYRDVYPSPLLGSGQPIPFINDFTKTNNRFVSYYGNAAYTFLNSYTFSISGRRDASNLFGLKTNDKWKPLWSTGLSWDVTKEKFYKFEFLPMLKLRATYGVQGNLDPSKVALTTISYSGGLSYFTQTPNSEIRNYVNPELKWEQTAMFNIGLDWAVKNNRLSGSVEYYTKKMTDLYGSLPVESTLGISSLAIRNVGASKGHGFDVILNSRNLIGKFKWESNLILNTYKDKVVKLNNPTEADAGNLVNSLGFRGFEGYPVFAYFAYAYKGLDPQTGDPQGYLNGQVTKNYRDIFNQSTFADIKYMGSLFPTLFGSVGNTFSYKGFSLATRITYKFNYFFLRRHLDYSNLIQSGISSDEYSSRWQKPGDELNTDVPSFVYPNNNNRQRFYNSSEAVAAKGDHIRLQYISLSYALSKEKFKQLPFKTATLSVVTNNIGILWRANKYHIDPENRVGIPDPRSVAFGLNIGL